MAPVITSMVPGLDQFLLDYPGMAVVPSRQAGLELHGTLAFRATAANRPEITDRYELTILVPTAYPSALPKVIETGGRIPRDGHHHINPDDTLCLGSPLRLLLKVSRQPTLNGFAETCVVPYLYAISHKLKFGGPFVFDELDHGAPGALRDYIELFGVERPEQAQAAWLLLATKERRANKMPCPCGCGRRLGRCPFNNRLRRFRGLASRSWFRTNTL